MDRDKSNNGKIIFEDITESEIRTCLSEQRNRESCFENHPLSPRTIRGYYASLSSFFNWAVAEDFLEASPLVNISKPKTPKYLLDPFSKDEIEGLHAACGALPSHTSHGAKAMLLVFIDSGVRMSELVNLELPDLGEQQLSSLSVTREFFCVSNTVRL